MAVTPPTNQKNFNISFALHDGEEPLLLVHLPIRPEELTRTEPSRTSVVNSLDGAWVDSFGRGLTNLTLTGNTGWRIRNGKDGIQNFMQLRDEIIHKWHETRADRAKAGKDPSDVRLIFIDPINGQYVADVVPTSFTLRRSKSQPLLLMYNIALVVTNDKAFNPYPWLMEQSNPINDPNASLSSMLGSIQKITDLQASLKGALASVSAFGASVNAWTASTFGPVMAAAKDVIQLANDTKAVITAAGQIAIDLARDLSAVGTQLWGAVAAVTSLPNAIKSQVMQIKSEFSNLRCVLANGYKTAYQAESYSDWYGASNCSSTLGGQLSGQSGNPFETSTSTALVATKVSDAAAKAIRDIKNIDPIAPIDTSKLQTSVKSMDDGIWV